LSGATVGALDLDVRAGEIVGIAGQLGSGREHVASLLFGAIPRDGDVRLGGAPLACSPRAAVVRDVGLVPADRRTEGAVMDLTVRENITLPRLRKWRIDRRAEDAETRTWMERVDLRPPAPERALKLFSGGNQQKVVLAKWLRNEPKVLLLDEPTQGVDVGAKAAIYELVAGAADAGAAVLVASSDTKELAMLCDRVLVLRDGRVGAELRDDDLNEAQLVRESLGGADA
jgi:ribose transport system ATP-binding protein